MWHEVPLMVIAFGTGLLPECVPEKPISTDPPGGIMPFHAAFVRVTDDPLLVALADHTLVMVCPAEKSNANSHDCMGASDVLVMVRLAVNPDAQSFVV
jgi:hypothetical protein